MKAYATLSTTVGLMKHIDVEAEFSGCAIQMPAEQFDHWLHLPERAQSFLEDPESVRSASALYDAAACVPNGSNDKRRMQGEA